MRKSKKQKLNYTQLDRSEREEIVSTLKKNNELNRKHLQQRKIKKFNYIKFKPKNQSPSEENEEIILTEKRANEHYKPSYAPVLKKAAEIFDVNSANKILQRTNQVIPLKNSILNDRRSHSAQGRIQLSLLGGEGT